MRATGSDAMRNIPLFLASVATMAAVSGATLSADRIKLRSGKTVDASFMSADTTRVRVLLANGSVAEFPIEDITAVEFTPRKAPPPPQAPDPAKKPAPVTVPTG